MQLIGVVPTDTSVLARTGEIYDNDGDKSQAFQYYYDVSCLPSFNVLVDHILFCFEIFSSFYLPNNCGKPICHFFVFGHTK